jgi:hypothetical protein
MLDHRFRARDPRDRQGGVSFRLQTRVALGQYRGLEGLDIIGELIERRRHEDD